MNDQKDNNNLPKEGFVRLPTVLSVFPISESVWWDGVRKGTYPKPVKLGKRISAWRVEDIRLMIEKFSNG